MTKIINKNFDTVEEAHKFLLSFLPFVDLPEEGCFAGEILITKKTEDLLKSYLGLSYGRIDKWGLQLYVDWQKQTTVIIEAQAVLYTGILDARLTTSLLDQLCNLE